MAQEAGVSLSELAEMPACEAKAWMEHTLHGPSRMQVLNLLAVIASMITGFSKSPREAKHFMPWMSGLFGEDEEGEGLKEKVLQEMRDRHQSRAYIATGWAGE